ncbi:MAG: hypothetical protein HY747_06195 [Elusimicrobia bacterium]|nr:hypothetical protein [Elusimicrobiota bacterium]
MTTEQTHSLSWLIHDSPAGSPVPLLRTQDVKSKCASLKGAAELLPNSPPEEVREILELMAQHVKSLAKAIAEYKDQQ